MRPRFSRQFLALSLLISLPLGAMNPKANTKLSQHITTSYSRVLLKKMLENKEKGLPALAMTPAAAVDVAKDVAKEPSTINVVLSLAAGATAGAGFVILAPPVVLGVGLGTLTSWLLWDTYKGRSADNSEFRDNSPTIVDTTAAFTTGFQAGPSIERNPDGSITDPETQFIVRPGTARYAELMAKKEPVYAVVQPAANVQMRKGNGNDKKPNKADIAKAAAKAVGGTGGPKKPEDDKKVRKVNPHDFKQRIKKEMKDDYYTTKEGGMRLKDNGTPIKDANGVEIYETRPDYSHRDLECLDKKGNHLGSLDPVDRVIYKPGIGHRDFKRGIVGIAAAEWILEGNAEAAQPDEPNKVPQEHRESMLKEAVRSIFDPQFAEYLIGQKPFEPSVAVAAIERGKEFKKLLDAVEVAKATPATPTTVTTPTPAAAGWQDTGYISDNDNSPVTYQMPVHINTGVYMPAASPNANDALGTVCTPPPVAPVIPPMPVNGMPAAAPSGYTPSARSWSNDTSDSSSTYSNDYGSTGGWSGSSSGASHSGTPAWSMGVSFGKGE